MADLPAYENIRFSPIQIDTESEEGRAAAWEEIRRETGNMLSEWGIELLRDGLGPYVKTVLVEKPYVCEDFGSLHRHFYGRKFRERPSKCCRIHFFNEKLSANQILPKSAQEHYIGFSVIEPLVKRCIGRTLLDPFKIGHDPNSVHLLSTRFHNRIAGTIYESPGFPYRTQNNEATVCAHVTMWAVCRFLSQKFRLYRKHLPYELIEMAGRRNGRIIPHHGLSYADYSEMLDRFGCHPVIVSNHGIGPNPFSSGTSGIANQRKFREFTKSLYCYMESGFPLIATFGGHVVSLVGHVSISNEEAAKRVAASDQPVHASQLVDEYVVMDDNYFPYQRMQRAFDEDSMYRRSLEQLRGIVVPLPDGVYLRPRDVDKFTRELLAAPDFRGRVDDALAELNETENIVYRPFLATGVSFKQFKQRELLANTTDRAINYQLQLSLPRFIWCVELSTPSLRARNRAFGEIMLDATAGESDLEPIFIRIGSQLARSRTIDGAFRLDYSDRNSYSSFAQYRHNLGASPHHATTS